MKKDIKLAKNAGFCYGVKRAVETTIKLKEDNPEKKVCVLGELIHNSNVISDLKSLGIETIDSLDKCNCDFCVIRSHGASPEIFEQAKSFGFKIIDLTCPDVKKVQEKAIELVKEGRLVLILGKAEHPEVVAIKAHANLYSDEEIFFVSDLKMVLEISEKIKQAK